MKTVLRKKPATPAPTSEPAPAPAAPPKFTARGGGKKRILLAVQEGKIDFTSMSSEAAKELNELLHSPEVQAQFNIGPLREHFDPAHCKRIYEALGIVFAGIGSVFKWPQPAIEQLIYTEQEKSELAEPTAAVLDEFAPKWLREHQALAALLLVFGAITQNKFRAAQAIAIAHAKAVRAGSVQPVASGSQPIAPTPAPVTEEKLRTELHTEMRRVGIKVPIATAPAPTAPEQVNLGPTGGPSIPEAGNASA